jgi:hypothetical protein
MCAVFLRFRFLRLQRKVGHLLGEAKLERRPHPEVHIIAMNIKVQDPFEFGKKGRSKKTCIRKSSMETEAIIDWKRVIKNMMAFPIKGSRFRMKFVKSEQSTLPFNSSCKTAGNI